MSNNRGRSPEQRFEQPKDEVEKEVQPKMVVGKFYDLNPPANVRSGIFRRVKCYAWHESKPDDYIVCGIPKGGREVKNFVLHFADTGIMVTPSPEEELVH